MERQRYKYFFTKFVFDMRDCETICAPATTPGSGAISVVRVSGPEAFGVCDRLIRLKKGSICSTPAGRVRFGEVLDGDAVLDEVLVSIFRAPHSYTGEDSVEISCHASAYIVSRMLELLCDAGARMAEPGEFTRRAFLSGKMDLSQAEAVADVIASNSQAALRVAMTQLKGAYSSELRRLRDQLVELASLMELELDFSEEDVEFADRSHLRGLLDRTGRHVASLIDSFRQGNAIRNGVPVAIVGAVNAGKSTLLNALVGHDRAIVSDVPGTTRDTVEESINLGGVLLRFVDTAGLRDTEDSVEKIGIGRSLKALAEAELVICVLDASKGSAAVLGELADIRPRLEHSPARLLVALNKMDRLGCASDAAALTCELRCLLHEGEELCCISAYSGEISELRAALERFCAGFTQMREDAVMVTNLRHLQALRNASASLDAVSTGMDSGLPTDLLAEDLRAAIRELNSIFGNTQAIDTEELLGSIFSRFCIGK